MKSILKVVLAVYIYIAILSSCTKEKFTIEPVCTDCQFKPPLEVLLSYPETLTRGASAFVKANLSGSYSGPVLVKWYSDNYQFPQSLRQIDTVSSNGSATCQFTFPWENSPRPWENPNTYYYIRCGVSLEDGLSVLEKTVKITADK